MDLLESVKMASATLASNRLRSALTMLGMIIGNASVIAMIGVGQGASRYAASQFESLGPNVLFIVPGNDKVRNRTFDIPKTLVLSDAVAIENEVPTVNLVAPQLQTQTTITYRSTTVSSLVVGTSETFPVVRDFDVQRGRFISKLDNQRGTLVAAIGSELAKNLFGSEDPIGQQVRIKNLSFQVVGLMESKGAFLGNNQDDVIFIPLSVMASRIVGQTSPFGTELTFISVSAQDQDSIRAASYQIRNLLRLRHKIVDEDDFTIRTQKQALEIIGSVTGALTIMLAAIAGISLLVGGIGIMNIMLVSVTERIQEIGLRKAIGASEDDILVQFMIESIILSAVGGTIGTCIGVGGVLLVGALTPLQAGISVPAILLAVSVSGGIGLFFGVVPARRAARMDPIVALRST
ncbi:ABC transporter permease [Lyngbya confervoides]|uniref:ABC transporter permease n=1 Tax=Lyngbya confervoides BDU141951 TaxID=1574623 RepID=A0ABD4T8P4_9CYAN|nr:ABC transporter permease [Lyngbya confervoides]MCM1985179.1 ABC transporter permease [Lyngbya confervoides BDU141951]